MKRQTKTKKQGTIRITNNNIDTRELGESLKNGIHRIKNAETYSTEHDTHSWKRYQNGNTPNSEVKENEMLHYKNTSQLNSNIVDDIHLFPRWLPWILVALTLTFRVHYVLQPKNWWILHPDEVYQTTEGRMYIIYF